MHANYGDSARGAVRLKTWSPRGARCPGWVLACSSGSDAQGRRGAGGVSGRRYSRRRRRQSGTPGRWRGGADGEAGRLPAPAERSGCRASRRGRGSPRRQRPGKAASPISLPPSRAVMSRHGHEPGDELWRRQGMRAAAGTCAAHSEPPARLSSRPPRWRVRWWSIMSGNSPCVLQPLVETRSAANGSDTPGKIAGEISNWRAVFDDIMTLSRPPVPRASVPGSDA